MPIVVDEGTERLVRELADAMGTTLDAAIREAVCRRLAAVVPAQTGLSAQEFDAEIARIQAEVAKLPVLDSRTPEDMLYDEFGLPK